VRLSLPLPPATDPLPRAPQQVLGKDAYDYEQEDDDAVGQTPVLLPLNRLGRRVHSHRWRGSYHRRHERPPQRWQQVSRAAHRHRASREVRPRVSGTAAQKVPRDPREAEGTVGKMLTSEDISVDIPAGTRATRHAARTHAASAGLILVRIHQIRHPCHPATGPATLFARAAACIAAPPPCMACSVGGRCAVVVV